MGRDEDGRFEFCIMQSLRNAFSTFRFSFQFALPLTFRHTDTTAQIAKFIFVPFDNTRPMDLNFDGNRQQEPLPAFERHKPTQIKFLIQSIENQNGYSLFGRHCFCYHMEHTHTLTFLLTSIMIQSIAQSRSLSLTHSFTIVNLKPIAAFQAVLFALTISM